MCFFFFSSRRRHTRSLCDWSSDVCSSDLTSVLRPGRILTWRALTNSSWKPRSSSTYHTGFQQLAGGLHHHLGYPLAGQPVGQRLQPRGEGLEGPHLLASAAVPVGHAHAGHHLVFGDVQPGAARYQQLHRRHLPSAVGWRPAGPTDQATLKRVLTATVRGAGKAPASVLSTDSLAPRKAELGRAPDSHPSWRPQAMRVLSAIDGQAPC